MIRKMKSSSKKIFIVSSVCLSVCRVCKLKHTEVDEEEVEKPLVCERAMYTYSCTGYYTCISEQQLSTVNQLTTHIRRTYHFKFVVVGFVHCRCSLSVCLSICCCHLFLCFDTFLYRVPLKNVHMCVDNFSA